MVLSTMEQDLGARVLAAGGASAFLAAEIRDTAALRKIQQIASQCDTERHTVGTASGKADGALQTAAKRSLHDARARLEEIRARATAALFEHGEKTRQLKATLTAFRDVADARADLNAVSACRAIADAYVQALHPLALHQRDGSLVEMDSVAEKIENLIDMVEAVRRKGSKYLFGDDMATNSRIIKSIEIRAVDAVIKARAVFVNVLDNEFRKFGWPMKVPLPGTDDHLINTINSYVLQLSQLQRVASDGDYVPERTRWHRALSDSWAVAAILRAPLARFKYHFLESFRVDAHGSEPNGHVGGNPSSTSRFDRPEWAAEFALDRIREATPFLSKIDIDGPRTADVKFAEGFCRVFAEKIAYDCELALRTSTNDADADVLIAHASETAKQFDAKLRSGIIRVKDPQHQDTENMDEPTFLSSLHVLSMNESFLTTWASSELRLAHAEVNILLSRALSVNGSSLPGEEPGEELYISSRADLEFLCQEIVDHIGNASVKCRSLESSDRVSMFLKLTELPLLQSVRSQLKEEIDRVDENCVTTEQIMRSARASFCALLISDSLEDRSIDHFYLQQEKRVGCGFYDDEISRLRSLHSANSATLCETVTSVFMDGVRTGYLDQARFGEISAPDAAIVLTHDLSESLVNPLTALEGSLVALKRAVPCRKTASTIWRPVASKLDRFVFDDIVLQSFVGASRNAMAAASSANSFLASTNCARMARQLAFDVTTLVSTFAAVTANPSQFLPSCAECGKILRIASSQVLLPSVPPRREEEEVVEALRAVSQSNDDSVVQSAGQVLASRIGASHIAPREALELFAIGGLKFAIPMM